MARSRKTTPAKYKADFIFRIKKAREALKVSQEEMAKALGIEQDHYKHYESRTIMPHHLIPQFCKVTGMHPWYILTGQSGARSPGGHSATVTSIQSKRKQVK